MNDNQITVQQAAQIGETTERTIYQWISDEKIKASKFLDRWLIDKDSLEAHLKSRKKSKK